MDRRRSRIQARLELTSRFLVFLDHSFLRVCLVLAMLYNVRQVCPVLCSLLRLSECRGDGSKPKELEIATKSFMTERESREVRRRHPQRRLQITSKRWNPVVVCGPRPRPSRSRCQLPLQNNLDNNDLNRTLSHFTAHVPLR
jgi:hypothetical protein